MKARTRNLLIAMVGMVMLGSATGSFADDWRGGHREREWRHEGERWTQEERHWRHDGGRRHFRDHEWRHDHRHLYRPMVHERVIVRPAPGYYGTPVYYERPYVPRYEPRIIIDFPTIVLPLR